MLSTHVHSAVQLMIDSDGCTDEVDSDDDNDTILDIDDNCPAG